LYSRLWVKILRDLGYLSFDEPFKKLINQERSQAIQGLFTGRPLNGITEDEETTAAR